MFFLTTRHALHPTYPAMIDQSKPTLLARLASRSHLWVWSVLFLSALICAMVSLLYLEQRKTIRISLVELENFRQARISLARGFLHVSLADTPDSPFSESNGLSLLNQAIASFESAQEFLQPGEHSATDDFRKSIGIFKNYLNDWRTNDSSRAGRILRLRRAMVDLEQQTNAIDTRTQLYLDHLLEKLNIQFYLGLGGAIILLAGVCVLVFYLNKMKDRFEKASRESEENYRFVVSTMQEILMVVDTDGNLLFVNPKAARSLTDCKSEPSAIVGRNICEFVGDEKGQQLIATYRQAVTSGERVTQEIQLHLERGERWFFNILQPITYGRGKIPAILSISLNITDRKKAEEEGEILRQQLNHAQKLESVGRLTGGVAHDFNNILSVITGYTEMALDQVDPSLPLHADLEKIFDAAKRSADIVRQLLAFSRQQSISPKVLDLNTTVEGMLKMLRRLIGEDVNLVWKPAAGLPPVVMDPSQVDQILANLCVNSRDAISDTGTITIETHSVIIDRNFCLAHPGFSEGRFILLSVSDTGCGIDKEVIEKIFDPFFTTKGIGHGTGLGLSTVYGIIHQNNGFIDLTSEPGRGTSFKIYLPQSVSEELWKAPSEQVQIESSRGENLLMVEDDPALLKMGRSMLEKLGYTIFTAETPDKALEMVQSQSLPQIDLLLTDVIMPEMNGKELAEKLTALHPALNVVYMSGYTANVIANHGALDEGIHFIQKPFSKSELALILRKALDEKTAAVS